MTGDQLLTLELATDGALTARVIALEEDCVMLLRAVSERARVETHTAIITMVIVDVVMIPEDVLHLAECLRPTCGPHVVDANCNHYTDLRLCSPLLAPSLVFTRESSWSLSGLVYDGVTTEVSCGGSLLNHFFAVADWMKHRLGCIHVLTYR